MKLYFHPDADRELLELSEEKQKVVYARVENLKEKGTSYKHFGRFTDGEQEIDCYRLKIKTDKPVEVNQRVIISVYQGQFVAYGIEHRDNVYSEDYLEEIKDRMY
ncbi:MAG: hypothetical protein ABEK16_04205 [Candidatus Nanohalobium sp.]